MHQFRMDKLVLLIENFWCDGKVLQGLIKKNELSPRKIRGTSEILYLPSGEGIVIRKEKVLEVT